MNVVCQSALGWQSMPSLHETATLALHSLLIKFCPITRMFLQYFAWSKFLFSSGQPFQFLDGPLYSKVFRKSQWPAAERRKTGS